VLAVWFLAAAGCANAPSDRGVGVGQEQKVTLTLANGNGDHQELQPFADAVTRLSDDTVHIDFRDNVQAGDPQAPTAIIDAVKAGRFDLGWGWGWPGSTFDAVNAPFLIDSDELESKVLGSPIANDALSAMDSLGVVGVGIQPGPLKLLSGSTHPFLRRADFVGATVAIGPENLTADALKTLGAKTIVIAGEGSIEGADAVEAQLQAIIGNHYQNAMRHTGINVVLRPRPVVYYANPSSFRALSEKQQQALRLAVQQSAAAALGNVRQVEDAAFAALCANGSDMAVASADDLASLRAAVQPIYDKLNQNPTTASAIVSIEAMKAQLPTRAPAHGCPNASSSATAGPTGTAAGSPVPGGFPEGTYEATISAAQMEASWKRFAIPPESQMSCPCKGGFTFKDGVMMGGDDDRWYYSFFGDHVTIGVQGSANGAFTVRWTFDGHQVTFSDMVGGDSGDRGVFESAPFVKVT
jgi:TRAP-type C4-dicarboxylate transport system substrate-binding protein